MFNGNKPQLISHRLHYNGNESCITSRHQSNITSEMIKTCLLTKIGQDQENYEGFCLDMCVKGLKTFAHVLYQDFYSHSNWVEMGRHSIYLHLLQPEEPVIPVAKGNSYLHPCDSTTTHFITSAVVCTIDFFDLMFYETTCVFLISFD